MTSARPLTSGRRVALVVWIALASLFGASCGTPDRAEARREPSATPAPTVAVPDVPALELPTDAPLVISGVAGLGERPVVRVRPGSYVRTPRGDDGATAPDGEAGVIVVRGAKRQIVDLTGVELLGSPRGTPLDELGGVGLVLQDCDDVIVRGGSFGGFRVCVAIERSHDVVLQDVRFDGWRAMRLSSTPAAEDSSDWLWPHENDAGEWAARYGAAISVHGSVGTRIERCRGRHGQNGILLTRCEGARLEQNDFSFLSGWGLALYRSSRNEVARNAFDYCVRGYSHGVYWRGQDSAGILIFEQSCDNVFVRNSATHGGDGVFLFAGRDLVDGRSAAPADADVAGSDRNVFFENDFSFAVANAIEATFSRDVWAIGNRLVGSHQHGVWGGYSTRLVVLRDEITGTKGGGVTIEHGVECAVVDSRLTDNEIGLELYWDEDPELVGGAYGRRRDTSSRDTLVSGNKFERNTRDFLVKRTTGLAFRDNQYAPSERPLIVSDTTGVRGDGAKVDARTMLGARDRHGPTGRLEDSSIVEYPRTEPEWLRRARAYEPPRRLLGAMPTREGPEGLDTIVMGEWGPWDRASGEPRPVPRARGGALANARWDATWFVFGRETRVEARVDPRRDVDAWRALASAPAATGVVGVWTDPFGGSKDVRAALGAEWFGLVARTTLTLDRPGRYRLLVTSDDGVRVTIDGVAVLENWTHHAPTRDRADVELSIGKHEITLEYFQLDGASALALELLPR